MKFRINIITLSYLLFSVFALASVSSSTDAYIAALAHLLEQKTIGDAELVTMLEAAEDGKIVNPISSVRAETSVEHFVANNALEELLQGEIDVSRVTAWAKENIKEQDRLRKKRKQTQEETKALWKDKSFVLSAGSKHSCAVTTNGTINCWGNDWDRQTPVPSGDFRSVSAGERFSCGIKVDGAISCAGTDCDKGQCSAPSGFFQFVSAGRRHACGVKIDGTIACWGDNSDGQTSAPSGVFRSVSAGRRHTCGVKGDSGVKCWGNNNPHHQIDIPANALRSISSISAGGYHNCALRDDHTVECWGFNHFGQSTAPSGVFRSISVGYGHNCGVRGDGTVACWGDNQDGQATAPAGIFRSVSAGERHTCGVRVEGKVECWGEDHEGQSSPPDNLIVLMRE